MADSVIVLGAGMVGVSVAVHLRRRGLDVALLDRNAPGEGASFGNAGIIQREAVFPHPFPRSIRELARIAGNRGVDAVYDPRALPGLARPLLGYWWNSAPARYRRVVAGQAALVATCLDEHLAMARAADAMELLRPTGWIRAYGDPAKLDAALAEAEAARRDFGVAYTALDAAGFAALEPAFQVERPGAIHWTEPLTVPDPNGLVLAYARLLEAEGGRITRGDATTLTPHGAGWRVMSEDGPLEAGTVVVALGAAALKVTRPLGYAPPLFGKRGYHMHYALRGNAALNRPVVDTSSGFALSPMRAGVRLTTGAEFARPDAPANPIQLERAEPIARTLLPLGERREEAVWMGVRPCLPDMLPAIGPMPGRANAWCAFGHAHQGHTLGPTTGRLLAEMMTGEAPFIPPEPYSPARFA